MTTPDAMVFVVDDDISVREALHSLIRSVGLAVQPFANAQLFLAHERPACPSCLVLDVRMPGMSGPELQKELAQRGQPIPIVFITGHGDIPMSVRAIKNGAIEFLPKPFRDEELLEAIRVALETDRVSREQWQELYTLQERYDSLTPREREVMALVVQGRLNKQTAAELGVSEITIKVHRHRVLEKMGVRSLPDLVRISEKLQARDPAGRAVP